MDYTSQAKAKVDAERVKLTERKREIERQLAQTAPRDVGLEPLKAFCKSVAEGLESLDAAGRQKLVSLLVDKIVAMPDRLDVFVIFPGGEGEPGLMVKQEFGLI